MALKIDLKITGSDIVKERLQRMRVSLDDFKEEFKEVGQYLVDFYANPVFDTEGQILGQRWASLSPSYEWRKRRTFPGRGILEATGKMRRSFAYHAGRTLLRVVNERQPIFSFHQLGTSKMPSRMIFLITDKVEQKVVSVFKNALLERIKRNYV